MKSAPVEDQLIPHSYSYPDDMSQSQAITRRPAKWSRRNDFIAAMQDQGHRISQANVQEEPIRPWSNTSSSDTGSSRSEDSTEPESAYISTVSVSTQALELEYECPAIKVLKNLMLVTIIAKFLPAKDLPRLRLTCKLWNDAIIPELRRRNNDHVLHGKPGMLRCVQTRCIVCSDCVLKYEKHLADFINVMANSKAVPFGNYRFWGSVLQTKFSRKLLPVCGQFISVLHLYSPNEAQGQLSSPKLAEFRNMLFNYVPNLTELSFHNCPIGTNPAPGFWNEGRLYDDQHRQSGTKLPKLKTIKASIRSMSEPMFFIDLFNAATNLEILDLKNSPMANIHFLLALKEKEANLDKLKELRLTGLGKGGIEILIQLSERKVNRLQLQRHLILHVEKGVIPENESWLRFLAFQSENLVELKIDVQHGAFLAKLPHMSALRTLRLLQGALVDCDLVACAPQLKEFEYVCSEGPPPFQDIDVGHLSHPGVKDVRVAIVGGYRQAVELGRLITLFPAVTRLELVLGSLKLLHLIWNKWHQLEYLKVMYAHNIQDGELAGADGTIDIDEYITGIPASAHGELRSEAALGFVRADVRQVKTLPGISDLKELREFTLCSWTKLAVTDISGYYGFGRAGTKLRRICLDCNGGAGGTATAEISLHCRKTILNALGPCGSFK